MIMYMIVFVNDISLDSFVLGYLSAVGKGDTVIFSSGVLPDIDMNCEMEGQTDTLARLCVMSRDKESVIIASAATQVEKGYYNSVFVIDNGHIVGVSDEINPNMVYDKGKCLRCYNTSAGRIGVIIGEDLLYPELWARLAVCAPSTIICLGVTSATAALCPSLATLCSCTVCCSAAGRHTVFADNGTLVRSSFEEVCKLPLPRSSPKPKVLTRTVSTKIESAP
ncbi:MAG: hypothetical protein K2I79_04330 [Clostridia bacterium]|nr:hypothetical protein [Clostridia bacterium]